MNTHYHIPAGLPLTDYVNAVWEVEGEENVTETILPKGVIEIVFSFANNIKGCMTQSQKALSATRCFIQGLHTETLYAEYQGRHHLFGIRLLPHRVEQLVGISPSELNNTCFDLTVLPGFHSLWHRLAGAHNFYERLSIITQALPAMSQPSCSRSEMLSSYFLSDHSDHFQSVDQLAKEVCYSTRQLNRVIQNLFGVSAEELTTYKKFIEAVKLIHTNAGSLTHVAYSAGFFDQAHFCRVFKSYAGMTASQYRKSKSQLPFHIISA